MPISTAVDLTRVSRVVGYKLKPANFEQITPYLPQRIAVLGEANVAEQALLDTDPYEFITAKEVAEKYGYGSPLHQMARILRPLSGNPLGGIPTVVYPQASAVDGEGELTAEQAVYKLGVTVATSVTENATHKLIINGRDNIDGVPYAFNVVKGDNQAAVTTAIIDAVNNVLSSPVAATLATTDVDLTTKWAGATAILSVEVDTQGKAAGIVYAEVAEGTDDGTGAVVLTDALAAMEEVWNTIIINPYGADQFDVLEAFNGIPDPDTPTGRYTSTAFYPCVALYGSALSDKDTIVAITNLAARTSQVTNVHCPAPNSAGFPWEAAANMAMTAVPIAQNSPHLDNGAKQYPDMPVPTDGDIGDFSDYNARDFMVKAGSSTVNLTGGKYTVQDFITTYDPDGEVVPKFRFVRDLILDWNVAYNVILLMKGSIQDMTIVPNDTPSRVSGVIKPKQVKQLYISLVTDLESLALVADASFSEDSLQVGINATNPARLDIFFRYKRTSTAHIVSTDAAVDFNYSS